MAAPMFEWGSRTYVMGVINMSPESFSGDGLCDIEKAVEQGLRFVEEGADILDVGGESTRPLTSASVESSVSGGRQGKTSQAVAMDEELRRVIPVIRQLSAEVNVPVSVDTYKSEVAKHAVEAGARIINDVWGLKADARLAEVAKSYNVPIVLMHNQQGTHYKDLLSEIKLSLQESVRAAVDTGVSRHNIWVDPGFGFGKTPEHNIEVLRRLNEVKALGFPVLVGTSRKSTIGAVLGLPIGERLEGTAATVALAIANGADLIRVHDVKAMARVARMADAVVRGWSLK